MGKGDVSRGRQDASASPLGSIAGKRIAFAGRLLSCDRKHAVRLVRAAGGTVVARDPDLLILAGGGSGARRSRRTISEAQFLALVGELEIAPDLGVDLSDVVPHDQARRLYPRLSDAQRRALIRRGLVHPLELPNGTGLRFRDLRVLREIDELLAAGSSFSQAVARLENRTSGQLEFGFGSSRDRPRPKRIDLTIDADSADAWFDVGFSADRDPSSFATAIAAYERALDIDSCHVPSLINLGNVYYELGQFGRAREIYARAAAIDGDNPRTHFNLGNACDELGDLLGAVRAYRQALVYWPSYGDAHFNLALVAEKLGSRVLARRQWQRFLQLEPGSEWAAVARSHLVDVERALQSDPAADAGESD